MLYEEFGKSKWNKVIFFIPFLLVLGFLGFHYINEKVVAKIYYENFYFDEEMASWNEKTANGAEYDSEEEKQMSIIQNKNMNQEYLAIFESYQSQNQQLFLEYEIKNLYALNWQNLKEMTVGYDMTNFDEKNYILRKNETNQYLIDHQLQLKSVKYSTDSALFVMNILEFCTTPLFFLLFFLLFFIHHFKKFEDGRIKFLLTLPLKRTNILKQDFVLFLKQVCLTMSLTVLFSFGCSFILSRKMTWNYPILTTILGKTHILPVYLYCILLVLAFIFVSCFLFLFTYLILLLSKKVIVALFLSFIISFSFNFLANTVPTTVQGLNPFAYINVGRIMKGTNKGLENLGSLETSSTEESNTPARLIVENENYYLNQSLAKKTHSVDIVLLPLVLSLFIFILIILNGYLMIHYKI